MKTEKAPGVFVKSREVAGCGGAVFNPSPGEAEVGGSVSSRPARVRHCLKKVGVN